jgi:predicted amidohydrolase YtcJ
VRHDSPALLQQLQRRQLLAFLACGVTTVLDTAISAATAREVQAWLAAGHPGPNFLTLDPPLVAPGGYMSRAFADTVIARPEDVDRALDLVQSVGAVGVKVPIERGFGPWTGLPIHSPEIRAAIVARARDRGLPIYVHASDEFEQSIGLDMGAYALVHTNFYGADPSPAFIQRMVESKAEIMTTFSIFDAELVRWHPERLDAPLVKTAAPSLEWETARDPGAWAEVARMEIAFAFPRLPGLGVRLLAWLAKREEDNRRALANSMRAAKLLHDAGVPVVVGSDAGNFGVLAQLHGVATLREIELLGEAGVPASDVLAAATRIPARRLGRDDVGTVEVGKRADLIIVRDDPLADLHALRTLRFTVKDGVAHTPEEWAAQETRD